MHCQILNGCDTISVHLIAVGNRNSPHRAGRKCVVSFSITFKVFNLQREGGYENSFAYLPFSDRLTADEALLGQIK